MEIRAFIPESLLRLVFSLALTDNCLSQSNLAITAMPNNNRDNLLEQAEILFADKGFYGTSINEVAAQVGLTKQGLLHYFPTKQKLYGAVLESATRFLMANTLRDDVADQEPLQQLLAIVAVMVSDDARMVRVSRLLVRELLDNPVRAGAAHKWYLAPFLERVESIVLEGQRQGVFKPVHAMAFVYNLLGSQQYFIVSQPTLEQLHGAEKYREHVANHARELRRIIESTLL